jgi:hypothetical protein
MNESKRTTTIILFDSYVTLCKQNTFNRGVEALDSMPNSELLKEMLKRDSLIFKHTKMYICINMVHINEMSYGKTQLLSKLCHLLDGQLAQ